MPVLLHELEKITEGRAVERFGGVVVFEMLDGLDLADVAPLVKPGLLVA